MCEACKEARLAGSSIQQLTAVNSNASSPVGSPQSSASQLEKTAMVRTARQLLSAITRVLLLADKVVIKTLLTAKDKVLKSLSKLEMVNSFTEFVKSFSQFGNEMVELAHLTGDRQNDLKSDKQRAQMGVARSVLEKSTMTLLTSSKTLLRHPECESAKINRSDVFHQMYKALQIIHDIVGDGPNSGSSHLQFSSSMANGDSGIALAQQPITAHKALRELDDLVEMTRVTMVGDNMQDKLTSALDTLSEVAQDFTDSAYTSHEHREKILELCENVRLELEILLRIGLNLDQQEASSPSGELETTILKTTGTTKQLRKLLQEVALSQASDVFRTNDDLDLLNTLRNISTSGGLAGDIEEVSVKFDEHSEQLQEVCKLLRHIASTEPLQINAEYMEHNLKYLSPQVICATRTSAANCNSKIAKENLDVFCDAWETSINDISMLVKDIGDLCSGRTDRQVYMSLPRPGKHGTTSKNLKPVRLDAEEQAKIAKLGLEMKLITSEMDAETEKWEEPDNDIVKRAKNMSSMAFSMYLFTRGEGPLRTTQDLFTQAEYFVDEGHKLYRSVKEFSQRVPTGVHKQDLVANMEEIPTFCQQLNFTIRSPTMGKAATFNKVDSAIQETKNLMNAISKVVTTCFVCFTKYNIEYKGSPHLTPQSWRHRSPDVLRTNGSDSESVKSASSEGAALKTPSFGKHVDRLNAF